MKYIWQQDDWPSFRWNAAVLLPLLSKARVAQGRFLGQVAGLGPQEDVQAHASVLVEEALKTSAIEGEKLDPASVRSSVARHLGLPTAGLPAPDRAIDGLVTALLDAAAEHEKPLTVSRIQGWHAGLFPTGYSGLHKVRAGRWRSSSRPMRVVSGAVGREKVHYEAPPADRVPGEMKRFLKWWDTSLGKEDGLLRAGAAHFYFVTIHPFEDGNGRIARVLTDMALAQDERLRLRYYSISSQIVKERDEYYRALELAQKSDGDLTAWLEWYLGCCFRALVRAETIVGHVLTKARFWKKHSAADLNARQRKVINRLLDQGQGGFEGGLTTRKYASMAKVSRATAFRELSSLIDSGLLRPDPGFKGRNMRYEPVW